MKGPGLEIRGESILDMALPYRERTQLRRTVYTGGDGPRVAVVSGIHGDELEGLYVCHRLGAWLEQLARSRPEALLGTVELYPAMNPLGLDTLQRSVPVYDADLNRSFPGHAEGLLPQRMADALMRGLEGAELVVDVHASNIFLREIPQVRINVEFADRLMPLARRMNLDLIWLHGAATVLEATLAHSLNAAGVPCLVVEMGVGMRVTPDFTEQLVTGLLNLWRDLGVLAPELDLPVAEHRPVVADDSNVHYLNAGTSGMFVASSVHRDRVQEGDTLGAVVSPHRGDVLSVVRAPAGGLLFTLREYPLVYEGSLMARIREG